MLSTPYLADDLFGVQEQLHDHNHMTTIYIYFFSSSFVFSRNWALWADTLSAQNLANEIFGVQEQLHDHNLYIRDLGIGHFGRTC